MIGYVIAGAIGAFALVRLAHLRRRAYGCGGGYYGHHRHGGWRSRGYGGRGGWHRMALYSLFERIDATPGQEKVILNAVEDLRSHGQKARDEWGRSRSQVAEAFKGEHLTEEQATQLLSPYATLFDELRAAGGNAMRKIHEALDERQRRILAELLEGGWGWRRA